MFATLLISIFLFLNSIVQIETCAATRPADSTTIPVSTTTTTACVPGEGLALTIDNNTMRLANQPPDATPIESCLTCTFGDRSFFTPHTGTPSSASARAAGRVSISVSCSSNANLCICTSDGVCCSSQPGLEEPFQFQIIPFCDDNNNCENNVVPFGEGGEFDCDDGNPRLVRELVDEETFEPFPLNDMNYFKADAVGCQGCGRLRTNVCQ